MSSRTLTRFELYALFVVWALLTFGGWAIAGLDFYWTLQKPSPIVSSEPPLVLQGCTSVKRLTDL